VRFAACRRVENASRGFSNASRHTWRNHPRIQLWRWDRRHPVRVAAIEIRIIPDDQAFETTLNLAAEVVGRLDGLDKLAKRIAVADLRGIYNDDWREYDQVQPDGSVRTVSNPPLSEAEFEKKLSLNEVDVTGDQMIDFFYDNEKMFAGHSVVVNSLSGLDFSDASAELFG
jgi:hypothetical protein